MKKSLGALLIAVSLLLAGNVQAHVQNENDPNDTRSPLDLKRLSFGHNARRFNIGIETFGTWPSRLLRKKGEFSIAIDTGRGSHFVAKVKQRNGQLRVAVFSRRPDMKRVGHGSASRDDQDSLNVSIKRRLVKGYRGPVKWSPASFFKSRNRCPSRCDDFAPNSSQGLWFRHPM